MRTAIAGVAMLRQAFNTELVTNLFGDGEFRFFFFSRAENRPRVHVSLPDGDAKFWLSPTVELVRNIGLGSPRRKEAGRLVQARQQEIIDAWKTTLEPEVTNIFGHGVWILVDDEELALSQFRVSLV